MQHGQQEFPAFPPTPTPPACFVLTYTECFQQVFTGLQFTYSWCLYWSTYIFLLSSMKCIVQNFLAGGWPANAIFSNPTTTRLVTAQEKSELAQLNSVWSAPAQFNAAQLSSPSAQTGCAPLTLSSVPAQLSSVSAKLCSAQLSFCSAQLSSRSAQLSSIPAQLSSVPAQLSSVSAQFSSAQFPLRSIHAQIIQSFFTDRTCLKQANSWYTWVSLL